MFRTIFWGEWMVDFLISVGYIDCGLEVHLSGEQA